ncbi:MAG: SWIM zinc finger family protein [Oscillospiraceae bacterium]|nr:SWIM zinc finger family protein [Oscillospiraceae bacterium]
MKWKNLFSKTILNRGYNYFCDCAVADMNYSDNVLNAVVSGSEDYDVEITLSGDEIEDMYCSCPYAEDGNYCKHMAAVLYEWEENADKCTEHNEDDIMFRPAYKEHIREAKHTRIKALVEKADDSLVRSFLSDILADNEKLCLRFYNMVNKQNKEVNVKNYFRQIDYIVKSCTGKDDYIDYHSACDFETELESFIDNDVQSLLDSGKYMSAFEIINYIFIVIGTVNIDDSDGEIGMLADSVYNMWTAILDKASSDEKIKMFEWFTAHLNGTVIDYAEEYIEKIIAEAFKEKIFEKKKLELFKEKIGESEKEESEWSRRYAVGKWAERYLDLFIKMNSDETKIENEIMKYSGNSAVRKLYIDMCLNKKEYEKVLVILDEGIESEKEYNGLVSEYSKMKKEIYLETGDKDAYLKQLSILVLEHDAGNMELYRELKQQYTAAEWSKLREVIFKKLPVNIDRSKYYNEEKLYDRLLECVVKSQGLFMLDRYADVLKNEYPEQLLEKYTDELNKLAKRTGTRNHYANIVSEMRKIKKIPGGTNTVEEIINEWKVIYKNRPAMMDELSKL